MILVALSIFIFHIDCLFTLNDKVSLPIVTHLLVFFAGVVLLTGHMIEKKKILFEGNLETLSLFLAKLVLIFHFNWITNIFVQITRIPSTCVRVWFVALI